MLDVYAARVFQPLLMRGCLLAGNAKHSVFDDLLDGLFQRAEGDGYLVAFGKRVRERVLGEIVVVLGDEGLALSGKDRRDMVARAAKRVWKVACGRECENEARVVLYEIRLGMKAFVAEWDARLTEEGKEGNEGEDKEDEDKAEMIEKGKKEGDTAASKKKGRKSRRRQLVRVE